MSIFGNAYVRLAGRSLLSGALAAGAVVYASNGNVDKTVLLAAGAAGIHAIMEVFTPLNKVVGAFREKGGAHTINYADLSATLDELVGQRDAINNVLSDLKHKYGGSAPDA